MTGYLPRVVDDELLQSLRRTGAVLIEGPKACGKTATASQRAASIIRVDVDPQVEPAMDVDPLLLLRGETPLLLDEWQEQPRLWNYVRREVDDRKKPGQFILTGSATPRDDAKQHSGAGRFSRITMRPMSLLRFADQVVLGPQQPAPTLTVITGSSLCYRRPDGVNVVPIALLGP